MRGGTWWDRESRVRRGLSNREGADVECQWGETLGQVGPGLALEVTACGLRGRGELEASGQAVN